VLCFVSRISLLENHLDFKLPFTALAGIIAAAIQATGTTGGFGTACTWSFVILTAAVEAAISFSKQKTNWLPWQRRAAALAATLIAVIVTGLLDWNAYRKEYLADDLRVNFQIPHPSQVGTNELALNFLVATKAPVSVLLEETIAVEIASTDFSNSPHRNSELCRLVAPMIVGKAATEIWVHPNQKVLHHSMERPPHSLSDAYEEFGKPFPFPDDGKLDMAFYEPKTVSNGGKDSSPGPVAVEGGKPVAVVANFETDPASWGNHNVITICGAIRYLSGDGRDTWAVCPAQVIAQVYQNGRPAGLSNGPFATTPFVFGANSNDSRCSVWKGL
jgi:hypothetical protein